MNTNGVSIRKITDDDTDNIIRWRNSFEVNNNFIYRRPLTREDHLNWLRNKVDTGEVAQFIIHSDELVQGLHLFYILNFLYNNSKLGFYIIFSEHNFVIPDMHNL